MWPLSNTWATDYKQRKSCALPGHRDAGVQIVELGSSKGNLLVLLTVCCLNLQLHQLLFYPLNGFLLRLHGPNQPSQQINVWQIVSGLKLILYTSFFFWYPLSGFFIFSYFGICFRTLQFSSGIRKLVPFSINLHKKSHMMSLNVWTKKIE